MALLLRLFFCLTFLASLCACRQQKYPYAIKDFRPALQTTLLSILSRGLVNNGNLLTESASRKELRKLTRSEHPLLRADALMILLDDATKEDSTLIWNHLDDTAMVSTDEGEFGEGFKTVSDVVVEYAIRQYDHPTDSLLIDKLITEHNYLSGAYRFVNRITPSAKHYPFLRAMAQREHFPFEELENVLFALASYQKPTDTALIKRAMNYRAWQLTHTSFWLMEKYPAATYLDILEDYGKRGLFGSPYSTGPSDYGDSYFSALASYKNERAATILARILTRIERDPCISDSGTLKDNLLDAVIKNPCPAYAVLLPIARRYREENPKVLIPLEEPPPAQEQ